MASTEWDSVLVVCTKEHELIVGCVPLADGADIVTNESGGARRQCCVWRAYRPADTFPQDARIEDACKSVCEVMEENLSGREKSGRELIAIHIGGGDTGDDILYCRGTVAKGRMKWVAIERAEDTAGEWHGAGRPSPWVSIKDKVGAGWDVPVGHTGRLDECALRIRGEDVEEVGEACVLRLLNCVQAMVRQVDGDVWHGPDGHYHLGSVVRHKDAKRKYHTLLADDDRGHVYYLEFLEVLPFV